MSLEKNSPCKVNLLLNILGRRADGFHELETLFHPVNLCDQLHFARAATGLRLTCSDATLPVDASNLVHRAATAFLTAAKISDGVAIHLEKKIPMAAGLGGGSGNAAVTLLGLNELFGSPLTVAQLHPLAATLGSDVNFFLQDRPALAFGRGEQITPVEVFPSMRGATMVLVRPGFGIATAWAYRALAGFPAALNGTPGRARRLAKALRTGTLATASGEFYNSLEAPALDKFPVLRLYQEFLREQGAAVTLMSGSGSTTFALFADAGRAGAALENFSAQFGTEGWSAGVPV